MSRDYRKELFIQSITDTLGSNPDALLAAFDKAFPPKPKHYYDSKGDSIHYVSPPKPKPRPEPVVVCAKCKKAIDPESNYCQHCAAPQMAEEKKSTSLAQHCPGCNVTFKFGDNYCSNCGRKRGMAEEKKSTDTIRYPGFDHVEPYEEPLWVNTTS